MGGGNNVLVVPSDINNAEIRETLITLASLDYAC